VNRDIFGTLAARLSSALAFLIPLYAFGTPLPSGKSELTVDVDGAAIEIHAYKPERRAARGVLLTLHGVGRNAAGYRDHAIPIAERHGFVVLAPYFDARRFPTWRYQHGGIVRPAKSGEASVEADERWTGRVLVKIVDAVRTREGTADAPYYMLGHSGGAQALSRVAGLMSTGAQRLVIANPGTYLWPTRDMRFPDGFGGLPQQWSNDETIRRYLAQPITLLLGTADVKQDADLSTRESAMAQGANRYERGINAFRTAQRVAQARGWAFNWKMVEVPDVGHSAARMFRSEEAVAVLQP
jgi:poly(3-hydroxybutyrate) depolymerase